MLGTNDNQTDMDITVILPEITFENNQCELDLHSPVGKLCSSSHDALFSECCTNSLLRQMDGAYTVGDPEREGSIPLIRHTIKGIKGFLFIYRLKFSTIKGDARSEIFTHLIQAVKLWAKAKQIYSSVLGYLSGTSLTIMAAKICLLYPTGDLIFLLKKFFHIFSMWDWPKPVILNHWNRNEYGRGNIDVWHPYQIVKDNEQMPIIMSQYPDTNTAFNVNEMNAKVIQKAFKNAYNQFKQRRSMLGAQYSWENTLFKKANYENDYDKYFIITCSDIDKLNWEADCASTKRDMRKKLNSWWEGQTIEDGRVILKEHLDFYHFFTRFEHRGICAIKEVDCMAWIVGIKFMGENTTENLTREQQEEFLKSFIPYNIEANVQIKYIILRLHKKRKTVFRLFLPMPT